MYIYIYVYIYIYMYIHIYIYIHIHGLTRKSTCFGGRGARPWLRSFLSPSSTRLSFHLQNASAGRVRGLCQAAKVVVPEPTCSPAATVCLRRRRERAGGETSSHLAWEWASASPSHINIYVPLCM